MSAKPLRVLFASRAYESPHTEGGYLLLKDLAARAAADPAIDASVLSSSKTRDASGGVTLLPAFSRGGWGLWPAVQFARALRRWAATSDIVHTAHVPTSTNSAVLRHVRGRATSGGTRFVQTVTALPERVKLRRNLFWGDAIVCLNDAASDEARRFHDNVLTIAPAVRPDRLQERTP